MKRGTPLRRKTPLVRRPIEQIAADLVKDKPGLTSKARRALRRARPRRNDAQWRAECLTVRGDWCRFPGCPHPQPVQMDHLIPRAHGGPSIVENGLPLCRVHHTMKTDHALLIDPAWLGGDQIDWLADEGHAEWLYDGVVVGRHRRLFTDGPDRRPTNERNET